MNKIGIVAVVAAAASLALAGCAQHDQTMPASSASQSGYSSKLGTTAPKHHHHRKHKAAASTTATTAPAATTTTTTTTGTSTSN